MFSKSACRIRRALSDKSGAVTVDFIVLTASVIIMFLLVIAPIYTGSEDLVNQISERLVAHASSIYN
jgi:hypothetical protein